MTTTDKEWWVFSTALADVALLVHCPRTGATGVVRNPTKEEWAEAFHAPSNPYRWRGGDERVESPPPRREPSATERQTQEQRFLEVRRRVRAMAGIPW